MAWMFTLYLLYGLAFFTLGVAILSRDIRLSELGIARLLWLLAVFGIIHGFHEWLELLQQLQPEINTPGFGYFRLLVVSCSFLFLLYFGIFINIISLYGDKALQQTPVVVKALVGGAAMVLILVAFYLDLTTGTDINVRRLVAFPAGLLSGVGLIVYSQVVRDLSEKVSRNFIAAGGFMVCYAIFTGIVPSETVIPLLNVEIILLRGASAFAIMFFTIKALSVFSIEQRELVNDQLLRFSQSEKLTSMGILAAGIAHEINNPLTNASLNLEMLRDRVGGAEPVDKKLDSLERNIDRASKIAQELLHFSREKGSSFEPVNLNDIIASSVHLLRNQENSSIIQLHLGDTPDISGIPYRLEEVFINVLMNSLDACGPDDLIEVTTFLDEEQVVAEITDTGHGIGTEQLSQVFDPFFTTKDIGKGTGLGLSVCYNIVKQHQGELSMVSSEQGGAVMTISFPVRIHDE